MAGVSQADHFHLLSESSSDFDGAVAQPGVLLLRVPGRGAPRRTRRAARRPACPSLARARTLTPPCARIAFHDSS